MPRIPNPYIAGPPVSGRDFYGRKDIFRFVQNTFSSPYQNVIVLYGQRRMGKTSVLFELSSRLSPEFHPIYFDLQDKAQQRLNDLLYDLAREVAGSLNLDSPPRADLLHDDNYFHERFLPQVYQNLGPKRLLLMFDEFDVLDMPEEELVHDAALQAFFPYLRRALMQDKQLAFVFVVGRRLDELDELRQSTFKMAKTASVSFLEETEARRLIVEPASGILEYDEEAVGQIISITACHPYLTQLVCSELFSYMETAGRTQVTVGDVEAVIDRAIAAGGAGLAWLWDGLPVAERFVLSAVAHAAGEGRAATQDEISHILGEYRVPFSGRELTRAPDNLNTWGLLKRTADGYEFVVELLRRWILREHPLEQAKRELESASPRAIQLYELASRAHQAGKLDKAIRLYERALAANPNHVLAQLGLAQALFEQGTIEEAIIEYKEAYRLNEVMARDGLVAAWQKRAEFLEKEGRTGEADRQYRAILDVASNDQRIMEWVAHRWITRGRKYLAEDRYEEAVAEYEKATELNVPGVREELIATRRAWAEFLEDAGMRERIADSLIRRGDRYLEEGRYDEASRAYDQAENIQPEKQQALAQRRHRLELAPDYDKAMEAHQAREWGTAWERWTELYKKDPDYRGRDGKSERVAELLQMALDKHEKATSLIAWFVMGVIVVTIITFLLFEPLRCILEFRLTESVITLVAFFAVGAAGMTFKIAPPQTGKVLQSLYGGAAVAFIIVVIVMQFLPPPSQEGCFPARVPTLTPIPTPVYVMTPIYTETPTNTPPPTPTPTLAATATRF